MKTIVVASGKGGPGKTTLVENLSVQAASTGLKVAVMDFDAQGHLNAWHEARCGLYKEAAQDAAKEYAEDDVDVQLRNPRRLVELGRWLQGCRDDSYDLVLIDTPPAISSEIDTILRHADLVLIPAEPGSKNASPARATALLAQEADKPYMIVLNRIRTGSKIAEESREMLTAFGHVATTPLVNRVAYNDAAPGTTAIEYLTPGGRAAANEVAALWTEVADALAADAAAPRHLIEGA